MKFLDAIGSWLANAASMSRAENVAREDDRIAARHKGRRFATGTRPVIRWIKGDGLDDPVTRVAIGQATRLFGDRVDYCLCTNGIDARRVRSVLEWATQPVEWWPVTPDDNPRLAKILEAASCTPEKYGYWWKWFPERVRDNAPEWILDGDMVVTGIPSWFDDWAAGCDVCRMTQDDRWPLEGMYGSYVGLIDERQRLYSGLISLPPGLRYMGRIEKVFAEKPLAAGHDGRRDMCEQGVLAAAFKTIEPTPIPLYEFPFARAFEDAVDYGLRGDQGAGWGYHFGNSFQRNNPHFNRLVSEGVIFSRKDTPSVVERFAWLGGFGQWGVPGWTMPDGCAQVMVEHAERFAGRRVLELGTSRGRLTSMLASVGCRVTTVDRHDRGARQNLAGFDVSVVVGDAFRFLADTHGTFDLIIVDIHGNSRKNWRRLAPLLKRCLAQPGMLLLDNAELWKIPEWHAETGVDWFLKSLEPPWQYRIYGDTLPGVAVVTNG